MNLKNPSRRRVIWLLPPLLLGVAILAWSVNQRPTPERIDRGEPIHRVRIINTPQLDLLPSAEGYGAVRPARVWTAVAEVAGRVVEIHPRLRDGEILPKGTVLARIDPVDYRLALAQTRAELAQLAVQEENARASLIIEERNLELARQAWQRKLKLVQQGTAAQSAADEAERTLLGSRAAVQNLKNSLSLIPSQRQLLQAKSDRAQRDLEHTVIRAPFNLRVANLRIEGDQYAAKGQTLFEGDAVDRVEIEAQVALPELRRLFIGRSDIRTGALRLAAQLPEMAAFDPRVRLDLGDHVAEWRAGFVRFSDDVDPKTRTMGVVVAVDRPYDKIIAGYRPPLTKGMFLQVILRGKTQAGRLLVPRSAIRGDVVLVVDDQQRLERRPVEVLFNQGFFSVIAKGLKAGEPVVVSDLVPAVTGMRLQPQLDEALTARLLAAAGGDS